jgi:aryl-alcohol dehydrogenase-like predicted oxidoreductase
MAKSLGIAVVPYSPTGGGLLAGKYGVATRPQHGRLVDTKMYSIRYAQPAFYEVAERFTQLATELGHHPVTLAAAWVMSNPAVTSVLVGGRNAEQLAPAFAAQQLALDPETRAKISALSPEPPPATDRNEETSAHNYGSR